MLAKGLKEVAKGSKGLPAGVQIVGMPYQEERVLGFASYLEGEIKFYEKFGFAKCGG
jgi:Asp-tRNA(Asn)/Glu-tRNA(Gln) amidotransferase A subunit family amidase